MRCSSPIPLRVGLPYPKRLGIRGIEIFDQATGEQAVEEELADDEVGDAQSSGFAGQSQKTHVVEKGGDGSPVPADPLHHVIQGESVEQLWERAW